MERAIIINLDIMDNHAHSCKRLSYMRSHFFSRNKTTQHCEAMNAFLNRSLDRQSRLYELFQQVNRALTRIKHNEVGISKYIKSIIITRLVKIEKYTTNILTREIFHMYMPQFFLVRNHFSINSYMK